MRRPSSPPRAPAGTATAEGAGAGTVAPGAASGEPGPKAAPGPAPEGRAAAGATGLGRRVTARQQPAPRAEPARVDPAGGRSVQWPAGRVITEELPAVPSERRELEEGARRARRSAPYVLRLVVWLLVLVLVLLLFGVLVEHEHPGWLDFLRRTPSAAGPSRPARPAAPARGAASRTGGTGPAGFHLVSEGTTGATYAVGATSYQVLVETLPDHPCWVTVEEPAGSGRLYAAETLQPSARPTSFALSGSSTVTVAAEVRDLGVEVHGRVVGTIASPRLGYRYTFEPGTP